MRKNSILQIGVIITFTLLFFSSCRKDKSVSSSQLLSLNIQSKGSINSTSAFGDYNIATTVSTDGKVWTYTINRAKVNAKDLSHLIINLQNCLDPNLQSATFADIVSATLNGLPANLSPTEGSGTGCDPQASTTNFVKINFTAATSWVLIITYDRGYETFNTATVWLKAGTSCNMGTIAAPGCPKQNYCSFSQGYFFAPGSYNNGASALWVNGLTIGGVAYTHEDGRNFWDIDKGKGGNQGMNAFFQLGAVRLSGAETPVTAYVSLIETYFTGLNVAATITTGYNSNSTTYSYFNLPAVNNGITKADAIAAGSSIGSFIDANHCQ